MKINNLIFIALALFAQNAHANWVLFYESQTYDAKLLLSSVQQENQKTQALILISFKENLFSQKVGSQVIFLEHICGETNPTIIEEKFYEGLAERGNEIDIDKDKDLIKFKIYTKKIVPNLIKQICI
jgi:hypothetical protein|tara:strand:+ start:181 stop:561 length:381 start_codon:yes stop_codon:yes gene_type:complete